jgi:hypothetical protein
VNYTTEPVSARAPTPGRRSRGASPRSALVIAVIAVIASAGGCGRKATVEDCEQIVRRIAELELKDVVPKEELGNEVQQAEQSFRERALADCVGRRITEKSLACLATAKTAEAVIDDCFD